MQRKRQMIFGAACMMALALATILLGPSAKKTAALAADAPVEMAGHSFFNGTLIDSEYVVSDEANNQCPAVATLVHLEDDAYELRLSEACQSEPRLTIWELTIADDGSVTGTFHAQSITPAPETGSVMGEIWLHTGCMMVGDFPNLTGTWDGEQLRIYTSFEGRCHGGTMWGNGTIMQMLSGDDDPTGPVADGLDWDDGPARLEFGVDLTAMD